MKILTILFTLAFFTITSTPGISESWKPLGNDSDWQPLDDGDWNPMQAGWTALKQRLEHRSSAPSDYRAILDIIGRAESPRLGYDAVVYSARIKPTERPSQMTISEIYNWINATPGQNHAIGRYQFIPVTLRRVVAKAGIRPSQRFSEAVQDRLAIILIEEAGFASWKSQRLSDARFMDNLAGIWAGFPLANGRSAHHGVAGNRATVSRSAVREAINQNTSSTTTMTPPASDVGWVRSDQW